MAKIKYYYDAQTLSYRKIKVKKFQAYKKTIFGVLSFLLIAFFGFVVFSQFLTSPKERILKRELKNLKLHYQLLNKRAQESSKILAQLQERDNYIYRAYFEVNPIPEEQRKAGFGGVNRYKYLEGFNNSKMIKDATKNIDILSKQIAVQSKSLDEIVGLAKEKEKMLASIPAIQPIKKQDLTRIAAGFGMRMHPILKTMRMHKGIDFAAPIGTPIYASGNGTVVKAHRSPTFGNVVYINHGYGYETIYGHMKKIKTKKGQKVKRGDLIGYLGSTGRSTGPHLHYEIHKNGKPVNPVYFFYGNLTPEEFLAVQKASEEEGQSYD